MNILRFFIILFCISSCNLEEKNFDQLKNNPTSIIDTEESKFIKKNNLLAYWPKQSYPSIIICDEIATTEEIRSVLLFWEKLGYEFGEVRKGDLFRECMAQSPFFNSIRIRLPRSNEAEILENKIAVTITATKFDSYEILNADVICKEFVLEKRLSLEHELGHALGWSHIHIRGHIMHPEWMQIGEDFYLVDYETYIKTILSVSL